MGAILSKFWPNKSNNNNQPPLAIAGPPERLPLPPPPSSSRPSTTSQPVDKVSAAGEEKSTNHGRKSSKKQSQQHQKQLLEHQVQHQSGQQLEKSSGKNALPLSNQSFIYKTVLEATVSDAKANEEEERIIAAEAPGPFEIETDLLSPEIEEAVIKIQANVRGYLTRKQYRGVTPDRSVETSQPSPNVVSNQEPIESSNAPTSSSGILAPPPSFSDTPKELPLDYDDNQTAENQGKKIAEKLIELEKQVSQQAINKPLESTVDDVIISGKEENVDCGIEKDDFKQSPVACVADDLKSQCENKNQQIVENESVSPQRPLEIPSIETSEFTGPEEAAIRIQAAFRGYKVRKTISRETSPCPIREDAESGENSVQLREKDERNSTQDPERESILVLDQLEECLSQELMRSSINLEDEASLSSYSTDIDLNASLQSNISLRALTSTDSTHADDNSDPKLNMIGSDDLSATITNNQLEKTTIDEKPSITAKIPDIIKPERVNIGQIVDSSPSDPPLIPTGNQVPTDVPKTDRSADQSVDSLDSSSPKEENKIETIETEPVLLVPSNEKVNAIDESLKNKTDPVVNVELNGKLDVSESIKEEVKSREPKSVNESTTETIENVSESTSLTDNAKLIESTISVINKSTPSTDLKQLPKKNKESEIEPEISDMIVPEVGSSVEVSNNQIATNANPVNLPRKPDKITSPIPDVHSSSSLPETSDKQSDLNVDDNKLINEIDAPAQESQQEVIKLIKEDSFESDILILSDDKSDTLYDPFADDLTTPTISSNVQETTVDDEQSTKSSFVDDNLIKSVVDDINKDEGLLLYEANSKSTLDNQTINSVKVPDMSENITEVKDDILVNLDESDEDDEDSQKKPIEESTDSVPTSTIKINIHRPSEVELILAKSKELDDYVERIKSEEQLTKQSADYPTNKIISSEDQSERQGETTIIQSSDVSTATSTQIVDEKLSDLKSEKQMKVAPDSPEIVDSVQQSTFNYEESSTEEGVDTRNISTNPFLNQPDFDSDVESGKINLSDQISSDAKIDQLPQEEVSTTPVQQSKSSPPSVEIVTINKDEEQLEEIDSKESKIEKDKQLEIPVVPSKPVEVEATYLKSNTTKDENAKDDETPTKQENEDKSSSEAQIQDNSKETLIVSETETENQSKADEQITPLESSISSSASSSTVNQPVVDIEPIDVDNVEQEIKRSNESSTNDESESKPEEEEDSANPSDNLLLRLKDRETRSKSPNPFGRKKRRQKKNRGGAN